MRHGEEAVAVSQNLFDAIVDGKAERAKAIVEEELKAGADPMALISQTMVPAMDEVGRLFQEEEFFVPELMLAGRAMKAAMEPLRPLLAAAGAKPAGVVVAGAVKGDLHDIGKNLVISMLEGAGFQVIDLGADVTPQKFVEAIREHEPRDPLPLGAADGDDGGDEDHDRGDQAGGPAALRQDSGRRRAAEPDDTRWRSAPMATARPRPTPSRWRDGRSGWRIEASLLPMREKVARSAG